MSCLKEHIYYHQHHVELHNIYQSHRSQFWLYYQFVGKELKIKGLLYRQQLLFHQYKFYQVLKSYQCIDNYKFRLYLDYKLRFQIPKNNLQFLLHWLWNGLDRLGYLNQICIEHYWKVTFVTLVATINPEKYRPLLWW